MQTMVTKEALVMDRKGRKLAHKNFRTLTTAASKTAEDAESVLAKVCSFMQDVTTPEMGKLVTKQVSIALECLENSALTAYNLSCNIYIYIYIYITYKYAAEAHPNPEVLKTVTK
jgi:hypothetical protein